MVEKKCGFDINFIFSYCIIFKFNYCYWYFFCIKILYVKINVNNKDELYNLSYCGRILGG